MLLTARISNCILCLSLRVRRSPGPAGALSFVGMVARSACEEWWVGPFQLCRHKRKLKPRSPAKKYRVGTLKLKPRSSCKKYRVGAFSF
jgi:hypothetical protein